MRVRFRRRHGRATSPIGMIAFGVIGAGACFAAVGQGGGSAVGHGRPLDPTNTWGPALMGVLLLGVAAVGVYFLIQQVRELRNLTSADDHGGFLLPPGERTMGSPPPRDRGPVQYPPMPGSTPSQRPPWEN